MPLTLEQVEDRLKALDDRAGELERLIRLAKIDTRIPLLATNFDVEDAIFSPAVRVYNSGAVTTTNNVARNIPFDSERFDTDGMHSTSSSTALLTVKTAGIYQITGNIRWENNATGRRRLFIWLNGTTNIADVEYGVPPNASNITTMIVSTLYALVVGDFVALRVYQNSGDALDVVVNANYSPEFSMVWGAPPP